MYDSENPGRPPRTENLTDRTKGQIEKFELISEGVSESCKIDKI